MGEYGAGCSLACEEYGLVLDYVHPSLAPTGYALGDPVPFAIQGLLLSSHAKSVALGEVPTGFPEFVVHEEIPGSGRFRFAWYRHVHVERGTPA